MTSSHQSWWLTGPLVSDEALNLYPSFYGVLRTSYESLFPKLEGPHKLRAIEAKHTQLSEDSRCKTAKLGFDGLIA